VNGDWSVLAELFLGLVHLTDEVDESLTGLGHSLFRPVSELELTHGPRLSVLYSHIRVIAVISNRREDSDVCVNSTSYVRTASAHQQTQVYT